MNTLGVRRLWRSSSLQIGRNLLTVNVKKQILRCNFSITKLKDADSARELRDLIKEFPRPKETLQRILYEVALKLETLDWQPKFTLQRTASGSNETPQWKAHLSVNWPEKFVVEAEASQKSEAERIAALLACKKIKECGVLNTQLKPIIQNLQTLDQNSKQSIGNIFGLVAQKFESKHWHPQYISRPLKVSGISNQRLGWRTTLSMKWPQNHSVEGVGLKKGDAETAAATKALLWLRDQGVLDKRDLPILYSKEEKKELFDSRKAPVPISVPPNIRSLMTEVLRDYESAKSFLDEVNSSASLEDGEEVEPTYYRYLQSTHKLERRNEELYSKYQARTYATNETVKTMIRKQQELPIYNKRREILDLIRKNQVIVLSGETGCGKTTQIPQYVLDEQITQMNGASCNIVVTQPRRISAISIASRIAEERQEMVGDTVGYQVRLQAKFPRGNGSILFCSTGILLARLHSDPALQNISHLIVDEVHQRGVQTDLLVTLLKSIVRVNPSLKVVLMSATLNADLFSKYFNNCPMITVPGFMYPVTEHFLPEILSCLNKQHKKMTSKYPMVDYDLVINLIKYIDRSQDPGAILCFLPGWQDIKTVSDRLKMAFSRSTNYLICPIHSSLPPNEQQLIFSTPRNGVRKIVLATNIAETSITINDVVYVVDCGFHKETLFDAERGVACLETQWISKANAKQRRGRAGRVRPGHCFRLYDKYTLQRFDDYPVPEILRTPLERVVLDCKLYCPDVLAAAFLSKAPQPPDIETVEKAVSDLQKLSILDNQEKLTPLGQKVAYFSTHPRLSVALVTAAFFRCLQPVVTVAALLSATKNPFVASMETREQIREVKKEYDDNRYSDHLSMVNLYNSWKCTAQDQDENYQFCQNKRLHYRGMQYIHGLHELIFRNLEETKLIDDVNQCLSEENKVNSYASNDGMVLSALCTALFPNVIRVYKGDMGRCSINADAIVPMTLYGMEVAISKESVASKATNLPSPWLIYFTAMKSLQRRQVLVRDVSCVPSLLLFLSIHREATMVDMGKNVCLTVGDEARMKFLCSANDARLLKDFQSCFLALFWYYLATCRDPTLEDETIEKLKTKFLNVVDQLFRENYATSSIKRKANL